MISKIIIISLFTLELLLLTFWNEKYDVFLSPVILFLSSIGIGFFSLKSKDFQITNNLNYSYLLYVIPLLGAVIVGYYLNNIFLDNPIDFLDVSQSDVIPQIGFMVERFLTGGFPYDPIPDWGVYVLNPTYLPFQWLPFCFSELLNIDYRWVPFGVLTISLFYFTNYTNQLNIPFLSRMVIIMLPWIAWLYVIIDEPKVQAFTIETLIVGFYLILCISILKKNTILTAIAIGLCILSRFSFVLWLPLFGLVMLSNDWKKALRIAGIVLLMIIFIYVIPFLTKDWNIFFNGLAHHTKAAIAEWAPYWQNAGERPYHLFRGVGLAAFFYEYLEGDIPSKIKVLQITHLVLILICTSGFTLFYYLRKSKLSTPVFLVASLKIYFCIFYYFIQIPYIYLMMPLLFISILLIAVVFSKPEENEIINAPKM